MYSYTTTVPYSCRYSYQTVLEIAIMLFQVQLSYDSRLSYTTVLELAIIKFQVSSYTGTAIIQFQVQLSYNSRYSYHTVLGTLYGTVPGTDKIKSKEQLLYDTI